MSEAHGVLSKPAKRAAYDREQAIAVSHDKDDISFWGRSSRDGPGEDIFGQRRKKNTFGEGPFGQRRRNLSYAERIREDPGLSCRCSVSVQEARSLFDSLFGGTDPFADLKGTSNGNAWQIGTTKIKRADSSVIYEREDREETRRVYTIKFVGHKVSPFSSFASV